MNNATYIYALHDPRDWSIRYVGKANDPKARLKAHVQKARSAFRMHALAAELKEAGLTLGLSILQICSQSQWHVWERFWITTITASGADLFNVGPGGNGPSKLGPRSSETRAKISAKLKGHIHSPESLGKMSAALVGRAITPEWKAKISIGSLGKRKSPQAIAKSAAARTGKRRSPEARSRISAANWSRGKILGPQSVERRAKISAALTGIVRSPETCAKVSASLKARAADLR